MKKPTPLQVFQFGVPIIIGLVFLAGFINAFGALRTFGVLTIAAIVFLWVYSILGPDPY
jgi:hypothetical protein